MKRAFLYGLIIAIIFSVCPLTIEVGADDSIRNYDYLIHSDENSASVTFGREIKEVNCTFFDGIALGITDSTDPLYNEHKEVDGLDSRYFYNKNYPYVKIDEGFYEPEDRHYLVSIAFYDFGPNRGTFHFEYFDEQGEKKRITMVKTGKIQDWFVKTLYITDMDLSKSFENGANVRLVNGAFNAFKKLEIVNLSKLYREGIPSTISALTSAKMYNFEQLGIINQTEKEFSESNLYEPCTKEAALSLLNFISGKKYASDDETITCKALIQMYMNALGLKTSSDNLCQYALEKKLTTEADLFINDDAQATNYNLLAIAYNTFYYGDVKKGTFATKKITDGAFDNIDATVIDDANFISAYYSIPRKCEYKSITDNETGMTVKYMNIFGHETLKPYVTQQAWTSDAKSFIIALVTGQMYLYNTETQMLTYIDDVITDDIVCNATISPDDKVYYGKKNGSNGELWRYDIKTQESELLVDGGIDSSFYFPHISKDLKYLSVEYNYPEIKYKNPREYAIARLNLETMEFDIATHSFDYSNVLDHVQINPGYTDLMFFAHEYDSVTPQNNMVDRVWTYNYATGEKLNIFKQGIFDDGTCMQHATHEVWSRNGDYLYIIVPYYEGRLGKQPSTVRVDKDGRHRQYYYTDKIDYRMSHTSPTGDDKYLVTDGRYVIIISTETQEMFPVYRVVINRSNVHPNHPHPIVAENAYKVMWGMVYKGELGIGWLDFSDIGKRTAKGGRYDAGDNLTYVSYKGLDCEAKEVTKGGRKALFADKDKFLYIDADENIVDSVNAEVKISFDYYDNGNQPIVLTYTTGVENDNDYWKTDNATVKVERTGTNTWKHADILIESGNFENIGKYYTDFKINGLCSCVYLSNIKISTIEREKE